jgi:hypothetical protein
MKVAELIKILKKMPQDYPVEINNNAAGQILYIDQVDCFGPEDLEPGYDDYPVVMIQVE